jgi:predicted CxxxxCH...CXXCH cytochrome family protein
MTRATGSLLVSLCLAAGFMGCRERRDEPAPEVTFRELGPVLRAACGDCHGEQAPAGGYRVDGYLAVIGCTTDGRSAIEPRDESAPIVSVLSRPDHQGLLDAAARRLLLTWVEAGAPAFRGTVHAPGIIDPRSEHWHGRLVADVNEAGVPGWGPLLDPAHELNCGRCHAGSVSRPEGIRSAAPQATACTSCHAEPDGVLACGTCHGQGSRPEPPRDACFFGGTEGDPHAAHVAELRVRQEPFACATCHPEPGEPVLSGSHANGTLDVVIEPGVAGESPTYDESSMGCAVACHGRGGTFSDVVWQPREALDCQGCHLSPPAYHYPGACSTCHSEMGETNDSLTVGPKHLNGLVDLGDSSGSCGACHGTDESGWPADAAHRLHRNAVLTTPVECGACHAVPEQLEAEGHLDGQIRVRFAGRALRAGQSAVFDAETRTCAGVSCHGAGLSPAAVVPTWQAGSGDASACVGCHATPPPPPHVDLPGCGGGLCHGAEVAKTANGYRITESGRALHINGVLDAGDR